MEATTKQAPNRGSDATSRCPVKLLRRIGSTTYEVTVHFSNTNKETMEDKLLRMFEREVEKGA